MFSRGNPLFLLVKCPDMITWRIGIKITEMDFPALSYKKIDGITQKLSKNKQINFWKENPSKSNFQFLTVSALDFVFNDFYYTFFFFFFSEENDQLFNIKTLFGSQFKPI